jgi:pyruvate decarboxylase
LKYRESSENVIYSRDPFISTFHWIWFTAPVPQLRLSLPLDLTARIDKVSQTKAVNAIIGAIYAAKHPDLLVDVLTDKHGAKLIAQELASLLKFPTFCPPMGKSIIDETNPYFYGVYFGKISYPGIQDSMEKNSDLVIHLGPFLSGSNTRGFSAKIEENKLIQVHANSVVVFGEVFGGIPIKSCKSVTFVGIAADQQFSQPSLRP